MILYKYLSPENALRVIGSRKLRFTPPSQLNDPFELRPQYESLNDAPEVQSQLTDENLRMVMREEINKQLDQMPVELFQFIPKESFQKFFAEATPITKQLAPELFGGITDVFKESLYTNLDRLVGILCLSEKNNVALMWAHYAHSHRGVVLGFDSTSPYFERRLHANDDFRHLEKVSYKQIPSVQIVNIEDGREILYTKNVEWEYENEWRMVVPLENADQVINANDADIHLFEYPPDGLQEVILGCRVSDAYRGEILTVLAEKSDLHHVRKFTTEIDEHDRTIRIIEVED